MAGVMPSGWRGVVRGADPRSAMLPVAILCLVLLMVVPVPAGLLDLFFILNIGISLIVLMVAINTRKPLDFLAFPTVLLFATLLRLSLNVASILGTVQHGLGVAEAAKVYVLLAIGDGLVAQVPALLLSIAAAMVVTRVGSDEGLAGQVTSQFSGAASWGPVAVILALLAMLPGMPALVILPAAAGAGYLAYRLRARPAAEVASDAAAPVPTTIDWADVSDTAAASLDIGFGLVPLVDEARQAPLMARITAIRRQLSKQLGFVLPPVRVRDDLTLSPFAYRRPSISRIWCRSAWSA